MYGNPSPKQGKFRLKHNKNNELLIGPQFSVGFMAQKRRDGLEQNLEIQPERAVVDVLHIVLDCIKLQSVFGIDRVESRDELVAVLDQLKD